MYQLVPAWNQSRVLECQHVLARHWSRWQLQRITAVCSTLFWHARSPTITHRAPAGVRWLLVGGCECVAILVTNQAPCAFTQFADTC